MDQSPQDKACRLPGSYTHAAPWGQSGGGQSLNKPLLINTLPGILALLAVLLTVSFLVLTLSTLTGLQLGNALVHPNPFAAYEAVWPGQSAASVAAFALGSRQGYMPCVAGASPRKPYASLEVRIAPGAYETLGDKGDCIHAPNNGIFRWMTVAIEDDQVQELQLFSDVLQQDTLLLYWGAPDAIAKAGNDSLLNLYWERSTYSAVASVLERDSVVRAVTLTAKKVIP